MDALSDHELKRLVVADSQRSIGEQRAFAMLGNVYPEPIGPAGSAGLTGPRAPLRTRTGINRPKIDSPRTLRTCCTRRRTSMNSCT